MDNATNRLFILGFLGGETVHKNNAVANLEDLVNTHLRFNKGMPVCFMLSIEPFSDTMVDLADYALTHGHKIGLIGHESAFSQTRVQPFIEQAAGRINRLRPDELLSTEMVNRISLWSDPRLILLADPVEDDHAYLAVQAATERNVMTRSLLNGLDLVILETDQQEPDMPIDPADYDGDDEVAIDGTPDFDDDDLEDLVSQGVDDDEVSDGEVDEPDDETLAAIEDEDTVEAEVVEQPDDDGDESEVEGEEQSSDPGDDVETEGEGEELEPGEGEPEEGQSEEATVPAATKTKWTEARLRRLYERNRPGFFEVARDNGITIGKGSKSAYVIRQILENQAGGKAKAATKAAGAKKAGPKKAAAATKKPAAATSGRQKTPAAPSGAQLNGTSKEAVSALIATMEQSLKVLKQLVR